MVCWYLISILRNRNDVADIAWGLGFIVIAWTGVFYRESTGSCADAANVLITIWGVRLAWHIYQRNTGKPEDFRYHQWRMEWKNFYLRSFLQVFMLQGFFMFIIALPVMLINLSESGASIGFQARRNRLCGW
jgi:steroid 5-alpha reductase family enzyme